MSETVPRLPRMRVQHFEEEVIPPLRETSANRLTMRDTIPNLFSTSEDIPRLEDHYENLPANLKALNGSSKPSESPFTMFCKGLELSPARHSFASPFSFGRALAFKPGNELIHFASPSPIPMRPFHDLDSPFRPKKQFSKLNFDNPLFMFGPEDLDAEPSAKLSDDIRTPNLTKSPFMSHPQFDFMKKSIYNFSSALPQVAQSKNIYAPEHVFEVIDDSNDQPEIIEKAPSPPKIKEEKLKATANLSETTAHNSSEALRVKPRNSITESQMSSEDYHGSTHNALAVQPGVTQGPQEQKEKNKICCNCKKSRCLKLYCDCFARGEYCQGDCNCTQCLNTKESKKERDAAVQSILEKNPNAFKPKVDVTNDAAQTQTEEGKARHTTGCHCKKSGCQKKYCECFQAGVECTDMCKCENCKNTSHSGCMKKGKKKGNYHFGHEEPAKQAVEGSSRHSGNRTLPSSAETMTKSSKRGKQNQDIFEEEEDEEIYQASPTKKLFMDNPEAFQIKLTAKNAQVNAHMANMSKKKHNMGNIYEEDDSEYFPKENKGRKNSKNNIYQTPQQGLGVGKHNTNSSESISSPEKVPTHILRKKGMVKPFGYQNTEGFDFGYKK